MNYVNYLAIKVTRDGCICVLTLSGDLDIPGVPGFLMHAAHVVDERTERFVLDLAGLAVLECGGARALAALMNLLPSGCPVIIRSLSPAARRILDLLNLDLRQEPSAGPEHHDTPVRSAQKVPDDVSSARVLRGLGLY